MVKRLCAAMVGIAALLGAAKDANAQPATANSLQIGLGFRYGIDLEDGDLNPFGTGLGLDAGLTLPNAIYVGGVFDYFFGNSVTSRTEVLGQVVEVETSANIWQLMAEGGYDLGAGPFVLRPKLGVGIASLNGEVCSAGCDDDSETALALAPGATFIFMGPATVSLDVRYDIVMTDPSWNGLIFALGIGF